MSEKIQPLTAREIWDMAQRGESLPADRVLATFADESNWVQLYEGKCLRPDYEARACEWAFIGPIRPPFELAQHGLTKADHACHKEPRVSEDALRGYMDHKTRIK